MLTLFYEKQSNYSKHLRAKQLQYMCIDFQYFLHCLALVTVNISFGRSIDIDDAMAVPGVVTFVSAKDITGSNKTGPVVYDETVFADDKVTYLIPNK